MARGKLMIYMAAALQRVFPWSALLCIAVA
jgi:hypothetical protein